MFVNNRGKEEQSCRNTKQIKPFYNSMFAYYIGKKDRPAVGAFSEYSIAFNYFELLAFRCFLKLALIFSCLFVP